MRVESMASASASAAADADADARAHAAAAMMHCRAGQGRKWGGRWDEGTMNEGTMGRRAPTSNSSLETLTASAGPPLYLTLSPPEIPSHLISPHPMGPKNGTDRAATAAAAAAAAAAATVNQCFVRV
ncbi:hypothetical protein MBM_08441 [Drepanopeziza brunnea f. sp. 'multigermtubi' MB_m1]|uniref:Uncharacterized protein n=1 Tax=Marssonina brunnea f. sp. multigermtubi (strain MB_m1) TaxID=1072389 RepID=K1WXH3_MARBU|nr:uncharacterized protein MBM_08441 [Drepanopeziza brunnea f. sp. 'multigermtubi' MB_m1]EKD13358.1 hypothetical protein MBM_08441 [Drepanopeziza brunnea f. sp. 'multigermtubi' MB_m1]